MDILNSIVEWFQSYFGFSLNPSAYTSPVFLLSCSILIFSLVALFCFVNIILYFAVLYILENKSLLEKVSQYKLLVKIINFYKNIRLFYLLVEILLFIFCFSAIISYCIRVIIAYIE